MSDLDKTPMAYFQGQPSVVPKHPVEASWRAKAISKGIPEEWKQKLLLLDGTSPEKSRPLYSRDTRVPSVLHALGLVTGAAGGHVTGWDSVDWPTPLGQAVID